MEQIYCGDVKFAGKTDNLSLHKIKNDERFDNLSRVYVIVGDDKNNLALIYNSKREMWGFPGGHSEEGESVKETAERECAEEINYTVTNIEQKYAFSYKSGDKEQIHVLCFAKLGEEEHETFDEDESVSEVKFIPISEVAGKIDCGKIWKDIINEYKNWNKQ
ncbi:MAG: NUDIX hydrolase [Nanoarchaeota archaeon]|nr:NUDIX hydrolase [Nanoarchaeota archaeon]